MPLRVERREVVGSPDQDLSFRAPYRGARHAVQGLPDEPPVAGHEGKIQGSVGSQRDQDVLGGSELALPKIEGTHHEHHRAVGTGEDRDDARRDLIGIRDVARFRFREVIEPDDAPVTEPGVDFPIWCEPDHDRLGTAASTDENSAGRIQGERPRLPCVLLEIPGMLQGPSVVEDDRPVLTEGGIQLGGGCRGRTRHEDPQGDNRE